MIWELVYLTDLEICLFLKEELSQNCSNNYCIQDLQVKDLLWHFLFNLTDIFLSFCLVLSIPQLEND